MGSRRSKIMLTLLTTGFLVLGAFFVLVPLFWMISTSFKTLDKVFSLPIVWIPWPLHWENYPNAFSQFNFPRYFLNSFVIAIAVTLTNIFFCSLAGYSLAKFRYPSREFIFVAILSTLMLPMEVVMVPTFLIVKQFGWLNSYAGLIAPFVIDAFGIFLMRQYILGIPTDLIEAARIDGCSEFRIYWRVIMPLCKPALAALAIFTFRESWDQFIWPLIIISRDELKTLPLGIAMFESSFGTAYNEVMAVAVIGMIPMALLFFFFQRAFVQGIVLTGMK